MEAVIIGGSLIGLMHGIMLKHHGCNVLILEQSPRDLEAQAAGIGTSLQTRRFLDLHDYFKDRKLTLPSSGVRVLGLRDDIIAQLPLPMDMTSWDALYHRLRSNFDGAVSAYEPKPPPKQDNFGQVEYRRGRRVVSVSRGGEEGGRITVVHQDSTEANLRNEESKEADLVIGADGSNSTLRSILLPSASKRRYAGYALWRGLIPEADVSPETSKLFTGYCGFSINRSVNEVIIVYHIPGSGGSLTPGQRHLNFCWYSHLSPEQLEDVLLDSDGHRHHWSVPVGKMRPEVWKRQVKNGERLFSQACTELASKVREPFIQIISDRHSSRAAFYDGKVLLVGDALATLRPHTGMGVNQGANHALLLEKVLFGGEEEEDEGSGKISIQDWEREALDFAYMEKLKSISWGEYYLGGWRGWLPAMLLYHGTVQWRRFTGLVSKHFP